MAPFFSVVVPVYKVEAYLPQCVDSILTQTFSDFELLLVDDGSPDGCGALCDAYAAQDGRVSVIHQENRGLAGARRAGLEQARADYVCFVDSDDWVRADWLAVLHRCVTENGRPDMVVFDCIRDDGFPDQPLLAQPGFYDRARLEREIYPYMIWDRRKPFLTQLIPAFQWAKAARRELLLAHLAPASVRIPLFEDVAMAYECIRNAHSLYVCDEALYVYRVRGGSIMRHYDPEELAKLKLCRDYLMDHLVRQAPEMRQQVDAFMASKVMHAIYAQQEHGFGLMQAGRNIGGALDGTGLVRALDTAALPVQIRLLMGLLRHRAYVPAVLVYRARLWLYAHRPGAKKGG